MRTSFSTHGWPCLSVSLYVFFQREATSPPIIQKYPSKETGDLKEVLNYFRQLLRILGWLIIELNVNCGTGNKQWNVGKDPPYNVLELLRSLLVRTWTTVTDHGTFWGAGTLPMERNGCKFILKCIMHYKITNVFLCVNVCDMTTFMPPPMRLHSSRAWLRQSKMQCLVPGCFYICLFDVNIIFCIVFCWYYK